jgi:hypothetical protein
MGIGSISFYQQDQNYWNNLQAQNQSSAAESSLISAMGAAETNEETGLSRIANQSAINRVNKQISDLTTQLSGSSSSSTSSSTASNSSQSAPSSPYATAVGSVPVTWNTPLLTLGIPQNGDITVSDGTNTTSYASNGSDTVGNLISAFNANVAGNAYVSASLNSAGKIVITAKNTTETITVGGTFASDVGFAHGNTTFQPNAAVKPVTPQYSFGATTSKSTTSTSSKQPLQLTTALNETSAESVLTASGQAGTLVNMLA